MKRHLLILFGVLLAFAMVRTAEAQWHCLYATYDDPDSNGTGHNTTGVGVISENNFLALIMTPNTRNFILPYVNADSAVGRVNYAGYGSVTSGVYQLWSDGAFDQVLMKNAASIVATSDSMIYVASNDPDHNILVFKFENDTVEAPSPYKREATGATGVYGIALDGSGNVYVCGDTTSGALDDIKIFGPISQWTISHADAPIRTVDLPDGVYRDLAVTPDGTQLFVSDYGNRKVLKYTGSPASGYTLDGAFHFDVVDSLAGVIERPGPIGLAYMKTNNILAVAVDFHTYSSSAAHYDFGRIYLLNPSTGALISSDSSTSVIDDAKWNFDLTGAYNNRPNGGKSPGNASGYTSTYDVAFDGNGNLYTQSHFGWTIEKWAFNGSLPVISGVERVSPNVPENFRLLQNYPNPFNPTTVIEFTVSKPAAVRLTVYDLLGKEVSVLVDRQMDQGTYRATFDASNLPGGVYFYTLRSNGVSTTRKMVLVK